MREIADQVFAHSSAADSAQLRSKLSVLFDRLSSLLRVCGQYKQLLEGALRNRGVAVSPSTPALNVSPPPGALSPFKSVVVLSSPEVSCPSFLVRVALFSVYLLFTVLLLRCSDTAIPVSESRSGHVDG